MTSPHNKSRKEIRRFGFILGGMFSLLGGLSWLFHLWIPWPLLLVPGVLILAIVIPNLPILGHICRV